MSNLQTLHRECGVASDDVFLLDLDGTLCDVSHRVHLAMAKMWDEFHSLCQSDRPNPDVLRVVLLLQRSIMPVIVTGRNARWRAKTEAWLSDCGVSCEALLMRPDDDFRPDAELKLSLLDRHYGGRDSWLRRVVFALEDRERVVEAYRNLGIPTWQVRPETY